MNVSLRLLRGWLYRRCPAVSRTWYRKKLAGYERRWGLEDQGFTKEGFFRIFQRRVLSCCRPGVFYELVTGDGLVGSLGVWIEGLGKEWSVEAWEHQPHPLAALRKNRTGTQIHEGRLTNWSEKERRPNPTGITSRGSVESTALCRQIRNGGIRPGFVGIWNPTRRPVWMHRLRRAGYRLVLVYQRMEFYVSEETRGQITENRWQK